MHAVFDQSWKLLTEEEQTVLLRLLVSWGGSRREAAEAVAGVTLVLVRKPCRSGSHAANLRGVGARPVTFRTETTLSVPSTLVTKSLIRRSGAGRYDLHELIRQIAASKLANDAEKMEAAQERHSLYYLSLLEEQGVRLQSHILLLSAALKR